MSNGVDAWAKDSAAKDVFESFILWFREVFSDEETRRWAAEEMHRQADVLATPKSEMERDLYDRLQAIRTRVPLARPFVATFPNDLQSTGGRSPMVVESVAFLRGALAIARARNVRDPERRAEAAVKAILDVHEGRYRQLLRFLVDLRAIETGIACTKKDTLGALERELKPAWPRWLGDGSAFMRNALAHSDFQVLPEEDAVLLSPGKVAKKVSVAELLDDAERLLVLSADVNQFVRQRIIADTFASTDVVYGIISAIALADVDLGSEAIRLAKSRLLLPTPMTVVKAASESVSSGVAASLSASDGDGPR